MLRLASILYSIIGTSVAGAFIVAALVTGYDTLLPILVAAGVGAIIAVPVSYLIANALLTQK
ncbi:MAG: hypothetical protein ACJAWC_001918 [Yoonia sp.]|jgi:hypothetical protein